MYAAIEVPRPVGADSREGSHSRTVQRGRSGRYLADSGSFADSVADFQRDPIVQTLAAELGRDTWLERALGDILTADGAPRLRFIRLVDARYAELGGRISERHIAAVAHAVLALARAS